MFEQFAPALMGQHFVLRFSAGPRRLPHSRSKSGRIVRLRLYSPILFESDRVFRGIAR